MNNASVGNTIKRTAANLARRPYPESFFASHAPGSLRSAEGVVPLILEFLDVESVIDVGCGVGTWLSVFGANSVDDFLGIDGDYVPRGQLVIPVERFQAADLAKPLRIGRRFDLAVSLEVAEHIEPRSSKQFVASLVGLADSILFSAAIPRQRGSGHVNERWQSWWAARFAEYGYVPVDCVRRRIWSDPSVEWWYAQNMILYVSHNELDRSPALQREYELMGTNQLSLVHPARYVKWHQRLRKPFS